jgi:excisionase family DNA binding protein
MGSTRNNDGSRIGDKLTVPVGNADCVLLSDNTNKPTVPNTADELLTIADVARLLKVSMSGVRRLQQRRLIPFLKVGGVVRFTKADLVSFLERQRVERIG